MPIPGAFPGTIGSPPNDPGSYMFIFKDFTEYGYSLFL